MNALLDPDRKVGRAVPLLMSAAIVAADVLTPHEVMLSIFFVLPVLAAGWYHGFGFALGIALGLPAARLLVAVFLEPVWPLVFNAINAADRALVLVLVALMAARLAERMRDLKREVRKLEGLLPICASCKRIRDEGQQWRSIETYITARSEATFSHGLCPDCARRMFGESLRG